MVSQDKEDVGVEVETRGRAAGLFGMMSYDIRNLPGSRVYCIALT